MSRHVASLVYSKRVGSMSRKAVLAYFAERANNDGSGVWASKKRIADELECSRQNVITTIRALLSDDLIAEAGRRPCANGWTMEYNVNITAVRALPDAFECEAYGSRDLTGQNLDGSNDLTPRRKPRLHKPSVNRPKDDKSSLPKDEKPEAKPPFLAPKKKASHAVKLPDDFRPVLTEAARSIVDKWADGVFERELAAFKDHAADKGRTSKDWQAAFRTWIRNVRNWSKADGENSGQSRSGDGLFDAGRESLSSRSGKRDGIKLLSE